MSLAAADDTALPALPRAFRELFRREPLFAGAALVLALLSLPALAALALDDRTLMDVNVWVKPLKFSLSLTVYLATLAWFAGWLPPGGSKSRWYRVYAAAVVFCVAAEMAWIGGAAANGVASHFNVSTPALATLYPLMGLLAIYLTSATLVYGVLIWRHRESRLDPVFRLSVAAGLVLTFLLTVPVAGYMAAGTTGHAVGDGGDLRVAHFFATHALHFVPAFGFVAAGTLPRRTGRFAVFAFAAAFCGFVAFTLVQAAQGRPFLAILG